MLRHLRPSLLKELEKRNNMNNTRPNIIYDKTNEYCHICHRKLSFGNYGLSGFAGAWHIEHSVPRAKGGSEHLNNLFAACISCKLEKGTLSTRSARRKNGTTRAPLTKTVKKKIREENTVTGIIIGGFAGMVGGPVGVAWGATIGGIIGNENSPKR